MVACATLLSILTRLRPLISFWRVARVEVANTSPSDALPKKLANILGEGYMLMGQKDLAIANYKKSLELNPQNKNGREMLKKLEGQ